MAQNGFVDIVVVKEKLNSGKPVYVSHCTALGIASQGKDVEEAMKNIKEAIELYLEEQPEKYEELGIEEPPVFSVFEVKKDAKAAVAVR